jgi:GNAT superfamily N-acetyltransferase
VEGIRIDRRTADQASAMTGELVAVHVDARAELVHQPFYSPERFAERLAGHVAEPGFELVTGRIGDVLVGYAYGSSLPTDTRFWSSIEGTYDPEFVAETGSRTFWLRELLVRKRYQQRGFAHQLHDALLANRSEERAVLFVRGDNPARLLYLRWGWSVVGLLSPQGDSPRFDVMLRPLPISPGP